MKHNLNKILTSSKNILFTVMSVFFVFVIIFVFVLTLNKIEQGRYIGQEFEAKNTITVSGKGEIFAKPDLAMVNFSVVSEAKTVDLAMIDNTEKMNSIINFMKENGIEDRDLRTIAFRVNSRYEWHNGEVFPRQGGKRVLVGYEVHQSLEVRIRDMDKIGTVIQGGTDFGANKVGTLRFTIDNREELENKARGEAIKEAKEKAKILSSQLGVRMDKIIDFREVNRHRSFDRLFREELAIEQMDFELAPEIEVGENKIQVIIEITYQIR